MMQDAEVKALLKILELGQRQVAEGRVHDARKVIVELRRKLQASSGDRPVNAKR